MSPFAVPITAIGPVTAATMVFRENGLVHVAAIVKATFAFALHGPMHVAPPEPIFTREVHRMNNPTRSIVATSDVVPRLPAADVLLLGHAHAPGGSATHVSVRLVVGRGDTTLLDKTVQVVGDRRGAEIKPFRAMPLVYEKAYGGPGYRDNPLGTGVLTGDAPPNLVDPHAPDRVTGFGPISRSWPARSSLVPAEVRAALDRPVAEIVPGLDFRYFHAAPADQRVCHLLGDEWILLEGVHPDIPQLHLRLPGAQAQTRVVGTEADGRVFSLRADTLRIDADAERCTVVWRNSFPVREADLGALRLLGGIALPDMPIAWHVDAGERPAPSVRAAEPPRRTGAEGTLFLDDQPPLATTFTGTIEVDDDDIEPVQAGDFSSTTVLGSTQVPPTSPLPAFMHPDAAARTGPQAGPGPGAPGEPVAGTTMPLRPRAAASTGAPVPDTTVTLELQGASNPGERIPGTTMPFGPRAAPTPGAMRAVGPTTGPQAAPTPGAMRAVGPTTGPQAAPSPGVHRAPADPKEGTLDLSNDFAAIGRAVMPFAGGRQPTPAADPPRGAGPIPGAPWDHGQSVWTAGPPPSTRGQDGNMTVSLEDASTVDSGPLDLAGTLVPPASVRAREAPPEPVPPPAPPENVLPPAPPEKVLPPAPPEKAPPPEPARTGPLGQPSAAAPLQEPPADPWGQALRDQPEPPPPPAPPPARPAAPQQPSLRSALYKRFQKS